MGKAAAMTTFSSSAVYGSSFAFDPLTDVISFDGGETAESIQVSPSGGDVSIFLYSPTTVSYHYITLTGVDLRALKSSNFNFGPTDHLQIGDQTHGTSGDDLSNVLSFSGGDHGRLMGLGGDDTLTAVSGTNVLQGGAGNDTLNGGTGVDVLEGGDGNDNLNGGDGNDVLTNGYLSPDFVIGGNPALGIFVGAAGGDDNIDGGVGSDTAVLEYGDRSSGITLDNSVPGANTLYVGGVATSTIANVETLDFYGGSGSDVVHGGAGFNALWGQGGDDQLYGGSGDDYLYGGTGDDLLSGGAGTNTANYAFAPSGVTVNLNIAGAQNTVGEGVDTLVNIQNLAGSYNNDVLTGDGNANTLSGVGGNDVLQGGGGNDYLYGGDGTDWASYTDAPSGVTVSLAISAPQNTIGDGTDTLSSIEKLDGSNFADTLTAASTASTLYGEGGNDVLIGGAGNDVLNGGTGSDWASYENAASAVTVSLAIGGAQNTVGAGTDTLTSIEKLEGSAFADVLSAAATASTLYGEAGNDLLVGGAGDDLFNGGPGVDAVSYANAASAVTVSLLTSAAQATGGAGTDTLIGIEKLVGSNFADTLTAGTAGSTLNGGGGGDTLVGGPGNDILNGGLASDFADYSLASSGVTVSLAISAAQATGGAGTDTLVSIEKLVGSGFGDVLTGDSGANALYGQGGNDVLTGGAGQDTLGGGVGNDSFVFSAASDSTVASPDLIIDFASGDVIDLHAIDADTGTAGDQAFHLGSTVGHTGDIVVSYDGVHTKLDLYVNSDATADAEIQLNGNHTGLVAGDFVL